MLGALQSQLAVMQQKTARLEQQLQATSTAAPQAYDPEPTKPVEVSKTVAAVERRKDETPEQAVRREKAEFAEYFKRLDESREREAVDWRWTDQLSGALKSLADREQFKGSMVKTVRCAETLCRIDVSHDSMMAQRHFSSMVSRAVLEMHSIQWLDDASVVYVAREGTSLPDWSGALQAVASQ